MNSRDAQPARALAGAERKHVRSTQEIERFIRMKTILAISVVAGWGVWGAASYAQTPGPGQNPPSAAPAASSPATAPSAATTSDTAPRETIERIQLISFNDPPLDIISTLADQAGLQLEIDQRIQKGLDAQGDPIPKWGENLSARWENVTPREALEQFLSRYGMVLVEDTTSKKQQVTFKKTPAQEAAAKSAEEEADAKRAAAQVARESATEPRATDQARTTQSKPDAEDVQPIRIDDQQVMAAIDSLAKMAGIKHQYDPRLAAGITPDGKPSMLLSNTVTINWEGVAARDALEAVLANQGLMMIEDPKSKIATITYKPATEPRFTELIQLHNASATNMLVALSNAFPTVKMYADARTSQIMVTATEKELQVLTNLVRKLDVPLRQILIAAQFWETSKNPKSIKGIDWTGTLSAQNFTFGNGLTSVTNLISTPGGGASSVTLPSGRTVTSTPGSSTITSAKTEFTAGNQNPGISANTFSGFNPATAFLNADGVRAALSFLNTDADTESIATPRAVTLDGLSTELSVVRNVPVFEEQQGTQTQAGQQPSTVKPNYELKVDGTTLNAVGVRLIVMPRIVGETNVLLDLKPEISAQELAAEKKTLGGKVNEAPVFSRRKVNTSAVVPSGTTLVLGGLSSDEKSKSNVKVPILGDIPVLGLLFRKDEKSRNKSSLIIFVTPTILGESSFQTDAHEQKFMNNKRQKDDDRPESAWDSGAPYDWKSGLAPIKPSN